MSAANDRARFYLEQTVPELRELERKEIFTKPELQTIIKKRSHFEHRLNARGCTVSDYARCLQFEMDLEALRRKRVKRLGVKMTSYAGPRRIYNLFERATTRFHGDIGLWDQYLDYSRKQKSYRKIAEIQTRLLRLHPSKAELWVQAARLAVEDKGDVMEARSFLQRGLRIRPDSRGLWIEYGRLEVEFMLKLDKRKQILGLDGGEGDAGQDAVEEKDDFQGDTLRLPAITAAEWEADQEKDNSTDPVVTYDESSIQSGALPTAIFDAAMKQFGNDEEFALEFFDMMASFKAMPSQQPMLANILASLKLQTQKISAIMIRFIQRPLLGMSHGDSKYPKALGQALSRIKAALMQCHDAGDRTDLHILLVYWLVDLRDCEDLDADIQHVLDISLRKAWNLYKHEREQDKGAQSDQEAAMLATLQSKNLMHVVDDKGSHESQENA